MTAVTSRYELLEQLGQGGSGVVYKAMDLQLQRPVAIKRLMRSPGAGETHEDAGQLRQEALSLSALQHPNIVTIHDIGTDEDGPYVVMEYLEGQTLEQVVEGAPLPLEEFATLVQDTLGGLGAAHARGMLHRDLKPSNIMLVWLPTCEMQFKLLDFGIAKYCPAPTTQTTDVEGSVMGTVYFMAPEQFERGTLDQRTDLYSLGCSYYHALTGNYPFTADSAAGVMAAHLTHAPGPLAEWRTDLPPAVVEWVLRLMSRLPEDRPDSAAQALALFKLALQPPVRPLPKPSVSANPQVIRPVIQPVRLPQPEEAPSSGNAMSIIVPVICCLLLSAAAYGYWHFQESKKKYQPAPASSVATKTVANIVAAAPGEVASEPVPPDGSPKTEPAPTREVNVAAVADQMPASPPAAMQETTSATPAPPTPPPAMAATGAPLDPHALDQLRASLNQPVEVEGVVTSVGESKSGKTRYVNFARRAGESVSLAFRTAETESIFPKSRLEALQGVKVRARGTVTEFNGGLLIYIKDESALVRVD
ncbi:serine/threonine protein kinase [Verrucomicrobium sp. BvORR034]|uniref:serine/threonine-protein kinase n=1 Tax=Verrucomicrobium sp. BvORR034 TaxID=1396418 RepID=UPI00067904C1|nr:serine/threonine protein kinase [Verrucomicrobium sp. BvORR034]